MKKLLLLVVAFFAFSMTVSAQEDYSDPKFAKFGDNVEDRAGNIALLNFFTDAYKMKSYDEAITLMDQILERCPQASYNVYINGINIYRMKIATATSIDERYGYVDKIMELYDKRIEAFPDHERFGTHPSLAQKAVFFFENNKRDIARAFDIFRHAVKISKDLMDPDMAVMFFNALTDEFKNGVQLTPEDYITDYQLIMEYLAENTVTEADQAAMATIENLFAGSGAASCDVVEEIFRPQYEADPDNKELVQKILAMFSRGKCSSDFQLAITEKFYNLEPTADLAVMLGSIYDEKGDFEKALSYFNTAIEISDNQETKTNTLMRATSASIGAKQYRQAADYAKQLISIDPNSGYGYLYLAGAYAGGVTGCSGFDRQAAYWLVVDTYVKARSLFEGDETQVSNINQMVSSYTAMFPKVEDTFMRGLNPGDGYTVSCGWVSGRTVVRER